MRPNPYPFLVVGDYAMTWPTRGKLGRERLAAHLAHVEERDRRERRVMLVEPPAPPPLTVSEAAFQTLVVDLARWLGWACWHDNDSRRNDAGWPDLVLVRDERMIVAELKTERGRLRAEQAYWMRLLLRVQGVEYRLWRPRDWETIVRTLT